MSRPAPPPTPPGRPPGLAPPTPTPPAADGWAPPENFEGYHLLRPLGAGAMGQVYLAHDTLLDRPVAIKFISAASREAEQARQRFLVEARAVARLQQHPNVVAVYRVGAVDGFPYQVAEFVHGKPLDALPMPVSSTLANRIALDIASGLAAAHRQGVVHRDLKPGNAMLSEAGPVKLLDFGIAKLVGPGEPTTRPPPLAAVEASTGDFGAGPSPAPGAPPPGAAPPAAPPDRGAAPAAVAPEPEGLPAIETPNTRAYVLARARLEVRAEALADALAETADGGAQAARLILPQVRPSTPILEIFRLPPAETPGAALARTDDPFLPPAQAQADGSARPGGAAEAQDVARPGAASPASPAGSATPEGFARTSEEGEARLVIDGNMARVVMQAAPTPAQSRPGPGLPPVAGRPVDERLGRIGATQGLARTSTRLEDETRSALLASAFATAAASQDGTLGAHQLALTAPGAVLGTPLYMAPEVWTGAEATFAADIYSFGALMYHLCSGRPPHTGDTLGELRAKVLAGTHPPLLRAAAGVDPELARVVETCLSLDPRRRFAHGEALRAALAGLHPDRGGAGVPEGNPYRGLSAFEAEHRALFFGRDGELRQVLERMVVDPLVLVAGDSGTGKSSLCRAGVLPRIEGWLGDNRRWQTMTLVPGRHPIAAFCAALSPLVDTRETVLSRRLIDDPCDFARWLRGRLGRKNGLLIFFDQFEELATLSLPDEAAQLAEMLSWLAQPAPGVRLLATVRADFLGRLVELPHLGELLARSLFFLRPLGRERIREVIEGPARKLGFAFESEEMVDALVESTVRAGGGGLPLLQFALAELWAHRDDAQAVIPTAALQAIGGVEGALSRHADEVIERLTPEQARRARHVLTALVSGDGTRARRSGAELGLSELPVAAAVDALVRARLVVARDTTFEIAHEALLRGWPTLARWLNDDADARLVHERLRVARREWSRLGEASDALWNVRQLEELRRVPETALSPDERRFVAASRRAVRRARARRIGLWAGVPLALVAVWLGLWLRSHLALQARVDTLVAAAAAGLADTQARLTTAEADRTEALAQFDVQKLDMAEATWKRWVEAADGVGPGLVEVGRTLETALQLDGQRADARALLAKVLLARAELAHLRNRPDEAAESEARLDLYDTDGGLRAALNAPGTVSLAVMPADARVTLLRFERAGDGRRSPVPISVHQGGFAAQPLAPGAWLVEALAPNRAAVRQAFEVRRGATLDLVLELPEARAVPEGFVYIPPGESLFGSAAPDSLRRDFFHTVPLHPVRTEGYLIGRTEVTFGAWLLYLEALPPERVEAALPKVGAGGFQGGLSLTREPDAPGRPGGWRLDYAPKQETRYTVREGEPLVYAARTRLQQHDWRQLPVVGITAADAVAYTDWLDASGRLPGARLCSEHEWERAGRGADAREYPHGDRLLADDANFDGTYGEQNPATMAPDAVGSHPASQSPYGLEDLSGNVWEWTRSVVEPGRFPARGGSYAFGANSARLTGRELTEAGFRDVSVGLRVCADFPLKPR